MRRSTLVVVGCLAALAIASAGPSSARAKRVAGRLAARHGCPRPLPPVLGDSLPSLTPMERCGVVAAGLALLPARRATMASHPPRDPSAPLVVEFVVSLAELDAWGSAGQYNTRMRLDPPRSFVDDLRRGSYWALGVAGRVGEDVVLYQVWVDRRSGTAHVVPPPRR
jgi:hypothetical protein